MVRFDQVLDIVERHVGTILPNASTDAIVVRDVAGAVTVVVPDNCMTDADLERAAQDLDKDLGNYSPGMTQVILRQSDLVDPDDILQSPDRVVIPERRDIQLVDRLLTNQDWLRKPILTKPRIPIATAFSIKGGVGRSTAFALWAWYLARQGKRVWVLDLDLEAPGIASMLVTTPDLPEYGLVDWFVESLAGQADPALLEGMLAESRLSDTTTGSIHVIPAIGQSTRDYVAKLGRVYMPRLAEGAMMEGFAHRIGSLVDTAAARNEAPDILLLDARAGLHDIGSAAVTQIGADVFLFARDDDQTWAAYEHLFNHLRMARSIEWGMPENDLRWRLKMVAAQIDVKEGALDRWLGRSYSCWSSFYDGELDFDDKDTHNDGTAQTFERADENAPHAPLPIFFDTQMRGLTLVNPAERPQWAFVEATFGQFFRGASARVFGMDDSAETDGEEP